MLLSQFVSEMRASSSVVTPATVSWVVILLAALGFVSLASACMVDSGTNLCLSQRWRVLSSLLVCSLNLIHTLVILISTSALVEGFIFKSQQSVVPPCAISTVDVVSDPGLHLNFVCLKCDSMISDWWTLLLSSMFWGVCVCLFCLYPVL